MNTSQKKQEFYGVFFFLIASFLFLLPPSLTYLQSNGAYGPILVGMLVASLWSSLSLIQAIKAGSSKGFYVLIVLDALCAIIGLFMFLLVSSL